MGSFKSTLTRNGAFYKGNLHCHTTLSDGEYSPADTARAYREHGYRFLGLSDHNRFFDHKELEDEDFLLMPAVERDITKERLPMEGKCHHIVGFSGGAGTSYQNGEAFAVPAWNGTQGAQEIIDGLREAGCCAILAHPLWSRCEPEDILGLTGLTGIEVYNHVSEVYSHTGYAELHWDSFLRRGIRLWGFAGDDTHDMAHAFGGWIVAKAPALTRQAIAGALLSGSFYASTGPELLDFYVQDGTAVVECSPARAVHFVTYERLGRTLRAASRPLTRASVSLSGRETYVRAEVVDENGGVAWSNPIFLK